MTFFKFNGKSRTIPSTHLYPLFTQEALRQIPNNKLTFLRGLPRSGKSTFAKEWLKQEKTRAIVCGDDFRLAIHGPTQYIRLAEPHVFASIFTAIRALLMKHEVLFDETNSSENSIRCIFEIDPAAEYVEFGTPPEVRFQRMIEKYKNEHSTLTCENVINNITHQLETTDVEKIRREYIN